MSTTDNYTVDASNPIGDGKTVDVVIHQDDGKTTVVKNDADYGN